MILNLQCLARNLQNHKERAVSDHLALAMAEIQLLKASRPCHGIYTVKVPVKSKEWNIPLSEVYSYHSDPFWCGDARLYLRIELGTGKGRNKIGLLLGHHRVGNSRTAFLKARFRRLGVNNFTGAEQTMACVLSGDRLGWTEYADFIPARDIWQDDGETYMLVKVYLYVRRTCKELDSSRLIAKPDWPECPF